MGKRGGVEGLGVGRGRLGGDNGERWRGGNGTGEMGTG